MRPSVAVERLYPYTGELAAFATVRKALFLPRNLESRTGRICFPAGSPGRTRGALLSDDRNRRASPVGGLCFFLPRPAGNYTPRSTARSTQSVHLPNLFLLDSCFQCPFTRFIKPAADNRSFSFGRSPARFRMPRMTPFSLKWHLTRSLAAWVYKGGMQPSEGPQLCALTS